MTNVVSPPNAVAILTDRNVFEQLAAAVAHTSFEGELLKFSKGEYLARNDEPIEPGTEFIAHVPGLQVGHVKWEDGRPIQHEMGYVADGYRPQRRSELGDNDPSAWAVDEQGQPRDPWQTTMHLPLTRRATGRRSSFTTSSKGGISAVGALAAAYGRRIRDNPNDLPIVSLAVGSYRHLNRAYGKIFVPQFDVIEWIDALLVPTFGPGDGDDPASPVQAPRPNPPGSGPSSGRSSAPAADTQF